MNFSLHSTMVLVPQDIRAEFDELMRREINSQEPSEGVKALYDKEPEQLKFDFTFST